MIPAMEDSQTTSESSIQRPLSTGRAEERRTLVETQLANRDIHDPRVLAAMVNVPRHWFVQEDAYADRPLPIGHDQTISQPYIVAHMTELLQLKPTEKVLEIGTGSGYQAAVLSELCDQVYTIEIIEPLGREAMRIFRQYGYSNIHCRIGDGHRGWPEAAPFDAIIVTCAPEDVPQALVDQLAKGGRLCIPVGANDESGQVIVLLTRQTDGSLHRENKSNVRFVPMTGSDS